MANYEEDSDDDIDNIIEEANHSEDNNEDNIQYVMTTYFSNKFFMYLLTAQDILPSNMVNTTQHFVLNQYAETVF